MQYQRSDNPNSDYILYTMDTGYNDENTGLFPSIARDPIVFKTVLEDLNILLETSIDDTYPTNPYPVNLHQDYNLSEMLAEQYTFIDFSQSQELSVEDTPFLSPQTATISLNKPPPAVHNNSGKVTISKHRNQCPDCKKKFGRPQEVRRHRLVHSGKREHQCAPCGNSFSRKDALTRHQKTCASC